MYCRETGTRRYKMVENRLVNTKDINKFIIEETRIRERTNTGEDNL